MQGLETNISQQLNARLSFGPVGAAELGPGIPSPRNQVLQAVAETLRNGVNSGFDLASSFSDGSQAINMVAGLWEGREITSWEDVIRRVVWDDMVENDDDLLDYGELLYRWRCSFVRWLQGGVLCSRATMFVHALTGSFFLPLEPRAKLSACLFFSGLLCILM